MTRVQTTLLAGLLCTAACLPTPAPAQEVHTLSVFVGNQGNFSDANGSVSAYDPGTGSGIQDAVTGLDALVQSITLDPARGLGYITANTADRIDIFDLNSHARTGQILNVTSPRYLTLVSHDKAYVSNLIFGAPGTVSVIDLTSNTVTSTIGVGNGPEDIVVLGNRAVVANFGFGDDTTITVLDTDGDHVTETKDVGCDGPRFLAADAEDEVWVFCTGKTEYNDDFTEIIDQTNGEVVVYNATIDTEVARFPLDVQLGSSAGTLGQDVYHEPATQEVFAVAGTTILAFDTATNTTADPIELAGTVPVSGIAYDAETDRFYVGRTPGYTEAGSVTLHDRTGAEVGSFDAGVAPAALALLQEIIPTASEPTGVPAAFHLAQNYPNPFNPATSIGFTLPRAAHVTLKVYSLLGETVATLADETLPAGDHVRTWAADGLPSGPYLYRLVVGDQTRSRTLTLVK